MEPRVAFSENVCTQCSVFSVALQGTAEGKAMIVNLASLVNELVNALNGQLKMVSVIKLITVVTSKNITDFKN